MHDTVKSSADTVAVTILNRVPVATDAGRGGWWEREIQENVRTEVLRSASSAQ